MKVGIFHWNFDSVGGGEILVRDIGKALDVPVYSIVTGDNPFNFIDISNRIPFFTKQLRKIRTLDYLTWSTVNVEDFGDFDMVLSSGGTTRSLIVPDHIPHINLCFSPSRWLYDLYSYRLNKMNGLLKTPVIPFAEFMRIWDKSVDSRVDYYISISEIIKRRLYKYLKRDSTIIHPPIDVKKYFNYEDQGYYLYISRLEPEKRPEEAIKACIDSNKTLVVIGTGSIENYLKNKYKKHKKILFRGFVEEYEKSIYLSSCAAVIYPAIAEDFGYVPIEALASGKPVICSNDGFPPILIGDKYGMITNGSAQDISRAIENMPKFDPENLRRCALQFDISIFGKRINETLMGFYDDFKNKFE